MYKNFDVVQSRDSNLLLEDWRHLPLACCWPFLVFIFANISLPFILDQPRPLFVCCRSFQTHRYSTEKTVGVRGIPTLIAGVEGKLADHFTTTTSQLSLNFSITFLYYFFNSVDSKRSIDWIWTADFRSRKRPLYQLSHNQCDQ